MPRHGRNRRAAAVALSDLGLSAEQEQLYLALLENPDLELRNLAGLASIGLDTVHETVDALIALKLVQPDTGRPASVVALDPTFALGRLVEQREDELMQAHRRTAETRSLIGELAARHARVGQDASAGPPPADDGASAGVEHIEGVAQVRERLAELSFFARASIMSVQPGGPQSKAALDASRRLDQRAVARGLRMRLIHGSSVIADELNRIHVRDLIGDGVEIRLTDRPVSRMVIIDERVAVVPRNPDNSSEGALIVRHPGLLMGFVQLFERVWQDSDEVPWHEDDAAAAADESISEQDRQILGLLAAGRTDETIARELGCSVRHLRRQIARLMGGLGAASRFEAGVEATRRGWL
jgi:sugar-specific transcriptional regulator TrmB/DNA-binding CsgD family transcriptional regulator